MVQGVEKRANPRAPMGTKIRWTVDGYTWHDDISRNISSGGLLLVTSRPVEGKSYVTLSINLPNLILEEPILVKAKVARLEERSGRQVAMGLCFVSMKSNNYEALQEFVCRILGIPREEIKTAAESGDLSEYVVDMEKLASDADAQVVEIAEKKLIKDQSKIQKKEQYKWIRRVIVTIVIIAGIAVLTKIIFWGRIIGDRIQGP